MKAMRHRPAPRGGPPVRARPPTAVWLTVGGAIVVLAAAFYFLRSRGASESMLPPAIPVQPGAASGYNLVLFTLDTTRADHLGCYGSTTVQTPNLDALAAAGVRFADAVATAPITLPSHASIMTGQLPPTCGVRHNGTFRLAEQHETLAERLRARGYATAAFLAAFVLDRRYGLAQGFDAYHDDVTRRYGPQDVRRRLLERPANVVIDDALAWLDQQHAQHPRQPVFAWIHLFDPHFPYNPPAPYDQTYADRPYGGEIAFMDKQIGRVIESLRAKGIFERTVVVAIADHGEGLGEHGESTHAMLIYDSTMRVPLILCAPGALPAGLIVSDRVVSAIDLAPTLLDLLGDAPPQCDGLSQLRPVPAQRAIYIETVAPRLSNGWSELHGLRTHASKFIQAPTPEFYDLANDPGETKNLLPAQRDAAEGLRRSLLNMLRTMPDPRSAMLPADSDAARRLAGLGYVSGGGDDDDDGPRPDPKDMIARWQAVSAEASTLVDRGQFAQAIPVLQAALRDMPNDVELWTLLAHAQRGLGRLHDAIESSRKALELSPADASGWLQLAAAQLGAGDSAGAEQSVQAAEAFDPDHGEIYLVRAEMARLAGDFDRAIALCEEARRRDPVRRTADAWVRQGAILEQLERIADARAAYGRALESDPRDAGALFALARLASADGDFARVAELCERILPGEPQWPAARDHLARAYLNLNRGQEALAVMRELVQTFPDSASTRNNLGNVLFQLQRYDEAAAAFRKAVSLDDKYVRGYFNLAKALKALGDLDGAMDQFNRAMALDPDLHAANLELARINLAQGRPNQAAKRLIELLRGGAVSLEELSADVDFAELVRSDPRFAEFAAPASQPTP